MAKRKVEGPGASNDGEAPLRKLSYREERFIEHFIDNGGNATQAYMQAYGVSASTANTNGPRLLVRAGISEAIEAERARLRQLLNFDREKALRIYLGMAIATVDDFAAVLKNPESRAAYRGLGEKRYALKSAKKSFKNGNEVQLVDRKAALDALWEKLGLGKEAGGRDRTAFLDAILALAGTARGEGEGR